MADHGNGSGTCPACGWESETRYDIGSDVPKYICNPADCRVIVFEVDDE